MSYNKSPFDYTPTKSVQKSRHNLSQEWKAPILPGELVPCLLEEAMPGDVLTISSEFAFSFAPMYLPMMQIYTMRCDYFFIPNRILFPKQDMEGDGQVNMWEAFIMGMPLGMATIPVIEVENFLDTTKKNNTIAAYFGLPLTPIGPGRANQIPGLNCIPFFAYLAIWNEYYRNPFLEPAVVTLISTNPVTNQANLRDGFKTTGVTDEDRFFCLSAKWEKDYFTSCTPNPQYGSAITVPVLTDGIIESTAWKRVSDGADPDTGKRIQTGATPGTTETEDNVPIYLDPTNNAPDIRQLRIAETLQAFWERVNRIGQRFSDFMKGMYNTTPDKGTIQVPVMFGSCFGRVRITDVMTTALTEVSENQGTQTGDYTGHASLYENDRKTHTIQVDEHGYYMAILQLNPNTSYGQGIARHWRRRIREDYPLDMFAGIGDQEVFAEELLYQNLTSDIDQNLFTFGYNDRFAEMKYGINKFVADLSWGQGLSWHAGRWIDLANLPDAYAQIAVLNPSFTNSSNTPDFPNDEARWGNRLLDQFRVLPKGYTGNAQEMVVWCHIFHSIYVNRALPYYSVPGKMIM